MPWDAYPGRQSRDRHCSMDLTTHSQHHALQVGPPNIDLGLGRPGPHMGPALVCPGFSEGCLSGWQSQVGQCSTDSKPTFGVTPANHVRPKIDLGPGQTGPHLGPALVCPGFSEGCLSREAKPGWPLQHGPNNPQSASRPTSSALLALTSAWADRATPGDPALFTQRVGVQVCLSMFVKMTLL